MPTTTDIATCIYFTSIDPFTKQKVNVAKGLQDRKLQRALMPFFEPEKWFALRESLIQAERLDMIGNSCNCLIPAYPPLEAIRTRRQRSINLDHCHRVANPANGEPISERGTASSGFRPVRN